MGESEVTQFISFLATAGIPGTPYLEYIRK